MSETNKPFGRCHELASLSSRFLFSVLNILIAFQQFEIGLPGPGLYYKLVSPKANLTARAPKRIPHHTSSMEPDVSRWIGINLDAVLNQTDKNRFSDGLRVLVSRATGTGHTRPLLIKSNDEFTNFLLVRNLMSYN